MSKKTKKRKTNQLEGVSKTLFDGKTIKFYHYIIHLGYYIPHGIRFFFNKPFKEPKKDLNILDQVGSLMSVNTTKENLDTCEHLIGLHRVVENTMARRRLERWSLRVIVSYLLIVFGIVVLSYCPIPSAFQQENNQPTQSTEKTQSKIPTETVKEVLDVPKEEKGFLRIPEAVMITILSTTTVNIIGLGLIVLRGHFLFNDQVKGKETDNTDMGG